LRNQVQLITYADRLAGSLPGLRQLLDGPLAGVFGGVHVLPFFRPYDGADAGFDPADHTEVDPRLGTWDDVTALGESRDVVVDVIVNHVSVDAPQFQDYLAQGQRSAYADMFLTLSSVFPSGVTEQDLLTLYRPRPGLPFTAYSFADGSNRLLWTTFTSSQIDLDLASSQARAYLTQVLERLAASGAAMIRLDAVGYAVKTAGTRSFMTSETFAMIDQLTAQARELGLEVLVEVHSHYKKQIEIGNRVDWVYDFALPPLILHTLASSDGTALLRWLRDRPHNAVTVLDTHDGIGVVDVGADSADKSLAGLLGPDDIDSLVEWIHANSDGTSRRATGSAASNVDLYQVNSTYYDALGGNDEHYLLSRVLQFFAPGIPQVYYVGLLAGSNDMDLLTRTGVGRDVNRRYYSAAEVRKELDRPVVQALLRLIRFRNAHPAFDGDFSSAGDGQAFELTWRRGEERTALAVDLSSDAYTLTWTAEGTQRSVSHVAELPY
jgi:sucrose phosphorylase